MPIKSGMEVLKIIWSNNINTLVFFTAKSEISDRVSGLDTGADDYLPKPFDANEFLARVKALSRRSNSYKFYFIYWQYYTRFK